MGWEMGQGGIFAGRKYGDIRIMGKIVLTLYGEYVMIM